MGRKPVSTFLQMYDNKKTRENYANAVTAYLRCFYPELSSQIPDADYYARQYLQDLCSTRNLLYDLRCTGNIFAKQYAPGTANFYLKTACLWLEDNEITISKRERKRIFHTMPPAQSTRQELELKRKIFRQIHSELPEWAGVLLLVLLGSGMRLGEAMSLQISDIDRTSERLAIHLRSATTKTKTARTVYLTNEAASALEKYLSDRADDDLRIFPYVKGTAQYYFRKAVDKAGFGKIHGGERQIHWHMTRKWFISRFSLAANKDLAEYLAGHEGYLGKSYRRYTKKQILKEFRKADKKLSIFL